MSRSGVLLCIALFVALGLRVLWLDQQCLNMDEVSEISTAHKPIAEIIWHPDSMPPGYSVVLKGWLAFFQTNDAARWLSLVCGVASVLCVWGLGRELCDESTAVSAAFVTAILPLHIYYSQFIRVYSLFFLFAALALWFVVLALKRGEVRYWAGFALIGVYGSYLHYYFAIVLAVSLLLVVVERGTMRIGARAWLAFIAIGIAIIPLAWLLPGDLHLQKIAGQARPSGIAAFGYTYFSFISGGSLGPSTRELHGMPTREALRIIAPWAALIGAIVAVLGYEGWKSARRHRATAALLMLLVLPPLITVGCGFALGLTYHPRFVVWSMIPAAIWLGAGISHGWHTQRVRIAMAGLLLVSGWALTNRNTSPGYQNEDLRGVAGFLACTPVNEPVYMLSDYLADVLRVYMQSEHTVVELPCKDEVQVAGWRPDHLENALATIKSHTPPGCGYWLVYSRPFHGDPAGLLLKELLDGGSMELSREYAGVKLFRGGALTADVSDERDVAFLGDKKPVRARDNLESQIIGNLP